MVIFLIRSGRGRILVKCQASSQHTSFIPTNLGGGKEFAYSLLPVNLREGCLLWTPLCKLKNWSSCWRGKYLYQSVSFSLKKENSKEPFPSLASGDRTIDWVFVNYIYPQGHNCSFVAPGMPVGDFYFLGNSDNC